MQNKGVIPLVHKTVGYTQLIGDLGLHCTRHDVRWWPFERIWI